MLERVSGLLSVPAHLCSLPPQRKVGDILLGALAGLGHHLLSPFLRLELHGLFLAAGSPTGDVELYNTSKQGCNSSNLCAYSFCVPVVQNTQDGLEIKSIICCAIQVTF